MGVTKKVTKEGYGSVARTGDLVSIEYTGYLKDPSKPDNKGPKQVHLSPGRTTEDEWPVSAQSHC